MNPKDQKFDPLEQDLPAGLRWSIPRSRSLGHGTRSVG